MCAGRHDTHRWSRYYYCEITIFILKIFINKYLFIYFYFICCAPTFIIHVLVEVVRVLVYYTSTTIYFAWRCMSRPKKLKKILILFFIFYFFSKNIIILIWLNKYLFLLPYLDKYCSMHRESASFFLAASR